MIDNQETSKSKKKEDEQAEDEQAEAVQVIFLGENSGKIDIITAYFDSHNSKFQYNSGSITIKVGNKFVKLVINGGFYRKDFNKIIIKNSSAGVFVYNTNDKKTFVKLNDWFKAMDEIKPGAPKAIIGYLGSIENEKVTEEELENLAKINNIKYYQVVNIDNIRDDLDGLFINLAKEVLEQRQSANNGEKNKGNKKEGNGCCCLIV